MPSPGTDSWQLPSTMTGRSDTTEDTCNYVEHTWSIGSTSTYQRHLSSVWDVIPSVKELWPKFLGYGWSLGASWDLVESKAVSFNGTLTLALGK